MDEELLLDDVNKTTGSEAASCAAASTLAAHETELGAAVPGSTSSARETREDVEEEMPVEFVCPITLAGLVDPVVAADGHTYEREAILRWFRSNATSPKTREPLRARAVVPNHAVRTQIAAWREARGLSPPERWIPPPEPQPAPEPEPQPQPQRRQIPPHLRANSLHLSAERAQDVVEAITQILHALPAQRQVFSLRKKNGVWK